MTKQQVGKIAVVGLGRVGLPLSLVLADVGYEVLGIDKDPVRQEVVSSGIMPFLEDKAAQLLKKHINKNLRISSLEEVKDCFAVVITVGTLLKNDFSPDLSALYEVIDSILSFLSPKTLIILRSTVEPNATKKIWEQITKSTNKKLYLVYAPERLAEGFAIPELYSLPQIIGSFDKASFKKAHEIFSKFAPQIISTDILTAELAKLTLNTYRYVKFAVANELMMITNFYGKDIYKVLAVANENYPRGGIPSPGFAAGPCLVKDSFFIGYKTNYNNIITSAYTVNNDLPRYLISELSRKVKLENKKVAYLGLTFKKNVDDTRNSLAIEMLKLLQERCKNVVTHDPYVTGGDLDTVLNNADILILAVDHNEYKKLSIKKLKNLLRKQAIICDIWNILKTESIFLEL